MTIPNWVADSIFYQIFPDRFMNGDPSNDPPVVLPWNAHATLMGFMGGDLRGISMRMDYLVDLGINAIYLNPIFQASSNHRYNTSDYFKIDPKLGNQLDFRELIATAHRRNIRVILDGVFNHSGRGFFAFNDILENGEFSPYIDWYHIKKFPLDAYTSGEAKNYDAWWNFKSLPKFNTANNQVRQFLFSIGRYWIEQGADGWRLDVPNEIDDDTFWDEFRHSVLDINPEAYLFGEIWDAIPRWVDDHHFDGVMNYPLRKAVLGLLTANWTTSRFAQVVERLLSIYPPENNLAMYNLLGSHHTERILTMLGGDEQTARLAVLLQFSLPGVPSVYYGDEIGLLGGKDPDCRGGFPWDEANWNTGLRDWYKQMIGARKKSSAIRRGTYRTLQTNDQSKVLVFVRMDQNQTVLVGINFSQAIQSIHIPISDLGWHDGYTVQDLLGGPGFVVAEGALTITIPSLSGVWLC